MGRRECLTPTYLLDLKDRLKCASHGKRGALVKSAANTYGVSSNTIYSNLGELGWSSDRKPRADCGNSKVSVEEAQLISNLIVSSSRATGKLLLSTKTAMEIARANDLIRTEASVSTVNRTMKQYGCHPQQLRQPSPHIAMRSKHPNHVWQFDVSVCVLYYLDDGGMAVMDEKKFYKNKPDNFSRIANKRVLRYLVTDHTSGAFYLRYFLRAGEDKETIFKFLVDAFTGREHPQDPFMGVPYMLVWDAGSANQAKMVKDFLDRLKVKHGAHIPGNPRAKGQVECTHNIVERDFEGRLSLVKITDLDQLNEAAWTWMRHYNGVKKHGRHGSTRYGLWQTIKQEQLRLSPPRQICEQLLRDGFKERNIRPDLTFSYAIQGDRARDYSVRHICTLNIGEKIRVCVNPYRYPCADVLITGQDGTEVQIECEPVEHDAYGFPVGAPIFGEEYKAVRQTPADRQRKEIRQAAYGVSTQQEVDKKRAKREPAFGGEIDPISYLHAETVAVYMKRPGRALEVPGQGEIELRPLDLVRAMQRLAAMLARPLTKDENTRIRTRYPDGIAEDALEEVMVWLTGDGSSDPRSSMSAVN